MANSASATIEAMAGCCVHIEAMCAALDEPGWHRPTALPAWDVQDVVAHLGSIEAMFLGRREPAHEPGPAPHVRNELGAMNERMVDRRRGWPGAAVLDEFRETTALRFARLRSLDETELDHPVRAPTGRTMPRRDALGVRLWDFLVHDMDIAEALGVAQDLESAAAGRVLDEMLLLVPRATAGEAAEGSVTSLVLGGPLSRALLVGVREGRGELLDPATAGEATLHLRASPTVFLRVGAGRRSAAEAIAAGDVTVDGDSARAARLLDAVNVVP